MKKSDRSPLPQRVTEAGGNRIGGAFRRTRYLWYSFLFPFVLVYVAYLTRLVFPVGNRCILTIDLYHQYAPFLSELYEKLSGFDSLLYTWNAGMGLNFLALSAYYLISPFNLILLLFPRANLPEAIAFIQVLKIGLCSLSMAYYLRRRFGREGMGIVLFGAFYALSAYILAYSWNIMWLDGILMLPVLALGLEEMIAGRRFVRYVIGLALTITFCYYIAYFICLFLVIYFLVAYFSRHPALRFGLFVRKGVKFAFFSVLAAGISMAVVLPTYTALQLTSAANDVSPATWNLSFNLFDFLTNHLLVVPLHIREGLPNIYCGLAALILIPLYFFSPSIPVRSKIAHLLGLLALFFSFSVNTLDFLWNGGHYPNQLPYRYAFVYVFLLLSMGYPVYIRLREFPARLIVGVSMAAAAFVVLADKLAADSADTLTVYLSLLFLAFLAAGMVYARSPRHPRELRVTVLSSVIIAELLVNTFVTVDLMDRTEYYSDRAGFVGDRVRLIDLMDTVEDDGTGDFYRVELLKPRTVNDTVLHSYRGISIFASTAYLKTTQLMRSLGLHNNGINSYCYYDSTPVLESMLGIRYLVSKDAAYARPTMEAVSNDGEYTVYRNPYALPVAYMVGDRIDGWKTTGGNPFEVQNDFLERSADVRDVLLPLDVKLVNSTNMTVQSSADAGSFSYTKPGSGSCSATLSIKVPVSREVSFYLDAGQLDTTEVLFGESDPAPKSYDLKRPYIVDLGRVEAGTEVLVKMTFKDAPNGSVKLYAVSMDEARFKQAMGVLASQGLDVESFDDTSITGTIRVETAGTMFTSIPYDRGWTVRVDGSPVETSALEDGLLSIRLEPGTHRIEMDYTPPRLMEGLLVSGASLLLLGLTFLVFRILRRQAPPDSPLADTWPPLPEWTGGEEEDESAGFTDPLGEIADRDNGGGSDGGLYATGRYRSERAALHAGRRTETHDRIRHVTLPEILPTETGTGEDAGDPHDAAMPDVLPPRIPMSPVDGLSRSAAAPAVMDTPAAAEGTAGGSGGGRGVDEPLEPGIRDDLAEQQGEQEENEREPGQHQQGVDRTP